MSIFYRVLWRRWLRRFRIEVNRSSIFLWYRRVEAFKARVFFRPDTYGSYRSIRLVDMKYRKKSDGKAEGRDAFLTNAWAALSLIEHNDPAAWRMVEREVKYLVNTYLSGAGQYQCEQRSCAVDYERCFKEAAPATSKDSTPPWAIGVSPRKPNTFLASVTAPAVPTSPVREWCIASLASTIVHEATHGRLHSLGIPYNKATRERIERLCVQRQRRFLACLHSDHYDLTTVRPPFDAKLWHPHWNRSAFQNRKEPLSRLFRDLRNAKK